MQTYTLKEQILHITPRGNFIETHEISVTRYFRRDGWSLVKVEEDKLPEFEPCFSYKSPAVDNFQKALDLRIDEGYAVSKRVIRTVNECVEEKVLNYVDYKGVKFSYAGDPLNIKTVLDYLKSIYKEAMPTRVFSLERTYGILDPEATLHVFHQLMNFLKAEKPRIRLEERLSPYITVIDDPLNQDLVGFSVFDDEGVKTKRKEIIGDGYVLEYLGTLSLGRPGNARGVIPQPDYFNLIVKGGDWGLEELREETKEGVIVIGVERSEVVKNSIRIIPRRVILIGKGEISVREIAIPIQELLTIDALTREVRSAYIDENHGGIAPYMRLKVRPIIY